MALEDDVRTFRAALSTAGAADCFEPPSWSELEWTRLFQRGAAVSFEAGKPILRRGATDRGLYFLVRGRAEVFTSDAASMSIPPLSRVVPGCVVGEVAFFDGKPRSASVWAVEPCNFLHITHEQFGEFEAEHPGLARDVLYAFGVVMAARLRYNAGRFAG
jgi:CRP/FNR family cyclic AMP-dependent transcriptional regulator